MRILRRAGVEQLEKDHRTSMSNIKGMCERHSRQMCRDRGSMRSGSWLDGEHGQESRYGQSWVWCSQLFG